MTSPQKARVAEEGMMRKSLSAWAVWFTLAILVSGVAHAGWKGAARGVVVNLVRVLHERYGAEPSRCLAGVGPTIGASRYEVGPKVPTAFLRKRTWTREYVSSRDGKLYFDLAGANTRFLLECGIPKDSIEVSGLCTYDTPDLLHSFRRDGTDAGHHGMVAAWPASS